MVELGWPDNGAVMKSSIGVIATKRSSKPDDLDWMVVCTQPRPRVVDGHEKLTRAEALIRAQEAIAAFMEQDAKAKETRRKVTRRAAVDPPVSALLADWYELGVQTLEGSAKILTSPALLGADGRLDVDQLLGIRQIEGLDPMETLVIRIRGDGAPKLNWCFDVATLGTPMPSFGGLSSPEGCSMSSSSETSVHAAAAREFREALTLKEFGPEARLVNARDLPDSPQPLPGVERWYVLREGIGF